MAATTRLIGGLVSATTLVALNPAIGLATYRSKRLEALIEGRPQILIHNGKLYETVLQDAKLTRHELHAALRQNGCDCVDDVHLAVLENNGSISVVQRKRDVARWSSAFPILATGGPLGFTARSAEPEPPPLRLRLFLQPRRACGSPVAPLRASTAVRPASTGWSRLRTTSRAQSTPPRAIVVWAPSAGPKSAAVLGKSQSMTIS